jgi:serine phosphatase RsbU (regulator of sigma subunit)
MCTDGILERADASGEFFGTGGLRQVVLDNRHASAQQILDRLYEVVTAHGAGRPWDDDATAVVVRRLETPEG